MATLGPGSFDSTHDVVLLLHKGLSFLEAGKFVIILESIDSVRYGVYTIYVIIDTDGCRIGAAGHTELQQRD